MEAVVERLDIKQQLLAKVDEKRRPGSIVSSNTSGIPIAAIAEGRSDDFRKHWLGTHFFNPPRYLRLLEIIPTAETDPAVVAAMVKFGDHVLGKGVVIAKDTPNFIANHVGLYGVARTLDALASGKYTIEEIDAITGPALGRPGSATFRTMDIAGIDVLAHVLRNLSEHLTDRVGSQGLRRRAARREADRERRARRKDRQGLLRATQERGRRNRDLDARSGDARSTARSSRRASPRSRPASRSTRSASACEMLFNSKDKAGEFLRETLAPTLVYTARVTPQIAHSIDDVDRAMRWGFGWELGPFELIDAIGIKDVLAAAQGTHAMEGGVPPLIASLLEGGLARFREGLVKPAAADLQILRTAKEQNRVIKKNAGASLVDLGDGVIAVEFHSKMNAIGGDTIQMLQAGVKEAAKSGQALVIGNDAPNFSAGANLMLVLLEAQEGNWDEIDMMIRAFQRRDDGAALQPGAGRRGARRAVARRRHRDSAALRSRAGGRGNLHGPRRSRRRPDSRRRRHQGNAGARDGAAADAAKRSAAVRVEGVRDGRAREGLGERSGCAAPRLPGADRFVHDESRAADGGCEGQGARARARGLSRAGAATRRFRSAANR